METTETTTVEQPAPTTDQQIKELISAQFDTDEAADTVPGEPIPEHDDSAEHGQPARGDQETDNPLQSLEDDQQDGQEATVEGASEHITLTDMASILSEKFGDEVTEKDIYTGLEVPIGNGETMTVGQLKDEIKQHGRVAERQAKVDQKADETERSLLATRTHLNAMMRVAQTPQEQQLLQRMLSVGSEYQKQFEKDQESMVLEAIPEWEDAEVRTRDRADVVRDLSQYGFSEAEVAHTQDARVIRFMRDYSKMKRELAEIRAASRKAPGKAKAPAGQQVQRKQTRLAKLMSAGKAAKTTQGKTAVVSELIRNQHG